MQKTILAILGVALFAGSAAQAASAKEHHHVGKAQRPPVATSQPFRNSNAAIRTAPRNEPGWYAPPIEPSRPNYYRDEALSPPAGH
jgi:hypothetical protein